MDKFLETHKEIENLNWPNAGNETESVIKKLSRKIKDHTIS